MVSPGSPWRQLPEQDPFEPWISAARVNYRTRQGYNQSMQLTAIDDKVDPDRTYSQRRDEILEKSGCRETPEPTPDSGPQGGDRQAPDDEVQ